MSSASSSTKRISHVSSLRGEKSICHPAAYQELVHFAQERFNDVDLPGNFGAAQDGDEGTLGDCSIVVDR